MAYFAASERFSCEHGALRRAFGSRCIVGTEPFYAGDILQRKPLYLIEYLLGPKANREGCPKDLWLCVRIDAHRTQLPAGEGADLRKNRG